MDFARALTFPFDDEEWLKKLGLAVLIQFIPIVGTFAIQGWSFGISQRVKQNDATPLPDWSDFGGLLSRGFMLFLAQLVYQIPTVIFFCVMSFIFLLPALGGESEEAIAALGGAAMFISVCCSCIIFLYAIAASLVYFAGWIRYIDTEELSTFFQFGDNIALFRENMGDFGQAILFFILAGVAVGVVSSVTFGIVGLVAAPFYAYFGGHIIGQLAQKVNTAPAV